MVLQVFHAFRKFGQTHHRLFFLLSERLQYDDLHCQSPARIAGLAEAAHALEVSGAAGWAEVLHGIEMSGMIGLTKGCARVDGFPDLRRQTHPYNAPMLEAWLKLCWQAQVVWDPKA